jgi:hypothetical protein
MHLSTAALFVDLSIKWIVHLSYVQNLIVV